MAAVTIHVVQAFTAVEDGGYLPEEPKQCPSAGAARSLALRLAAKHAGVIAWSRTGDPLTGDWEPGVEIMRAGAIPDDFEAGGGVE